MDIFKVCEIEGIHCYYSGTMPEDEVIIMRKGPNVEPGLVFMPYVPTLEKPEKEPDVQVIPTIDPPPRDVMHLRNAVLILGPFKTEEPYQAFIAKIKQHQKDLHQAVLDKLNQNNHESEGTI